jgi:hypothetical protein
MTITLGSSTATDLTAQFRNQQFRKQQLRNRQFRNRQSLRNLPVRSYLTGPTVGTTEMTPGAAYKAGVTATDVRNALLYQDGYARWQWATGRGVVGPTGSEQDFPFSMYNNPAGLHFALYQQFGYHHDLQAADAGLQVGWNYDQTNKASALRGFDVLIATRDVARALDAARREWGSSGFVVRGRY